TSVALPTSSPCRPITPSTGTSVSFSPTGCWRSSLRSASACCKPNGNARPNLPPPLRRGRVAGAPLFAEGPKVSSEQLACLADDILELLMGADETGVKRHAPHGGQQQAHHGGYVRLGGQFSSLYSGSDGPDEKL